MSAKSNRKTKQSFLNISSAVIDVSNVSRDENPQTENEMDSRVLKFFTISWIASLPAVIKIKHS